MDFQYDEELGTVIPPAQDCLVISSKGQVEQNDVTVRKRNPDRDNSDLPPECHDDLDVVQYRLTSDPKKKITRVLIDRPREEKDKNYYMEEIETHMTQTLKHGGIVVHILLLFS